MGGFCELTSGISGGTEDTGNLILVVEDDTRTLRLERFVLEEEGFTVREAKSGEEALQALNEQNARLVLLDIGLPGIDGFTTCRRIRKASQVPIIMVTAEDKDEDKVYGLEMGADDYVTKPFSTTELAARVKAVLRRYEVTSARDPLAAQTSRSEATVSTGATGVVDNSEAAQPAVSNVVPSNAPQAEPAIAPDLDGLIADSVDPATEPQFDAVEPAYEGTVRLLVESAGSVKNMIRFVDELRQHPLFYLLRLNANSSKEGMEILLRMREPVGLKAVLLGMENVSTVDELNPSQATPLENKKGQFRATKWEIPFRMTRRCAWCCTSKLNHRTYFHTDFTVSLKSIPFRPITKEEKPTQANGS